MENIIEGVVSQFDSINKNGRIYPKSTFEDVVKRMQDELELKRKNELRKKKLESL